MPSPLGTLTAGQSRCRRIAGVRVTYALRAGEATAPQADEDDDDGRDLEERAGPVGARSAPLEPDVLAPERADDPPERGEGLGGAEHLPLLGGVRRTGEKPGEGGVRQAAPGRRHHHEGDERAVPRYEDEPGEGEGEERRPDADEPRLAEERNEAPDEPALDDGRRDTDQDEEPGDRRRVVPEAAPCELRERRLEVRERRRVQERDEEERARRPGGAGRRARRAGESSAGSAVAAALSGRVSGRP